MKSNAAVTSILCGLLAMGCRKITSVPAEPPPHKSELPAAADLERFKSSLRAVARDMMVTGRVVNESGLPVSRAIVRYRVEDIQDLDGAPETEPADKLKTVETNEDGIFRISGNGVYEFNLRAVSREGYVPFVNQPLPVWRVPRAEGPANEDRSWVPILLLSETFAGKLSGIESDLSLKVDGVRVNVPAGSQHQTGTSGIALQVTGVASPTLGSTSMILHVNLEGAELRPIRSIEEKREFSAVQHLLLDASGSLTGSWKGGPPGGPLFLVRNADGAAGILRVTPVSMNESGLLDVSIQGSLMPELLTPGVRPTQAITSTPPQPADHKVRIAPVAIPRTKLEGPIGISSPLPAAARSAPGSYTITVEVTDENLSFITSDAMTVQRAGEVMAGKQSLETARKAGEAVTLQLSVVDGPSSTVTLFPDSAQQRPSTLFNIVPSNGATVSVEESDDKDFGWRPSRMLSENGKTLVPLPKFTKKFYRVILSRGAAGRAN